MNKSRKPFSIEEGKIQAAILLKSLKPANADQIKKAAKRFQRLPEFANLSITHLLQQKIQLKHALAVIVLLNMQKLKRIKN